MRSRSRVPFDAVRRGPDRQGTDGYVRQSYTLPRDEARAVARDWLRRFPRQGYDTQVESWAVLDGDRIAFTMRRFPTAD